MTIRLTVSRLTAARGGEPVAGPLDFTLRAGEALVVTGENGAGKSTLLRTLAGLLPPGGGTVRVEGASAPDGEPATRLAEVAHYLGHRHAMKAALTVAENLAFWRRLLGGVSEDGLSPRAALARVGLAGVEETPFGFLSAGQQRRSAIARLLVAKRPAWILDEPTAALDAGAQALFAGLLEEHLASGGLLVAATHQPLGIQARALRLERRSAPAAAAPTDADLAAAEGWS